MLDNNVNKNQQIPYQAMSPGQLNQQCVPMEAGVPANPELLKENIQDTYVANRVSETTEDPKAMLYTAGLAVPAWFAIAKGMDYYAKKSRGDYEHTVHGKIGKFGDMISNKVSESSLVKSDFGQSVLNKWQSFKNLVNTKVIEKSRILKAFLYTPSLPELSMVRDQAAGGIGFEGMDYRQVYEQFMNPVKGNMENLAQYGATKDEINSFKTLYKNAATDEAKNLIRQNAEFEILAKNQINNPGLITLDQFKALSSEAKETLLKEIKAKELGHISFADWEKISKNTADHLPEAFKAATKANPKMFMLYGGAEGTLKHNMIGRKVYMSEIANKFAAFLGNKNTPEWQTVLRETGYDAKIAKTGFGRGLTKYANMVMEGATNRVAGGKLVAIAQAAYLADVIYKSMTAEGGISEKTKSFAERFAEMLSFFICLPMALQLMHKIGGLQYAGMTPEQVAKYRERLKIHNEKAMSGGYASKEACEAEIKSLKQELKSGVKNPFTLLAKKIGRIVSVGLEQIRPYDSKDIADIAKDGTKTYRKGVWSKIKDLFRHPKFGIKQMAGYPMRIALGMFILLPMFNKIAVKGSHLIFGKPKHSLLDEGKEEENKQAQTQTQIPPQLQNPAVQQTQQTDQKTANNQLNSQGQTNLLNKYKNNPNAQQVFNQTQTTTTTNINNNNQQEPLRTYIPSPTGVVLNGQEDLSAADAAMKRADSAEQQALQTLKMN